MPKGAGVNPVPFLIAHRFASLTVTKVPHDSFIERCVGKVDRAEGLSSMKEFAKDLYSSKAWQKTRDAYKRSVGGLCEVCWAKGIVKPGEIVHHKIHLTPENIEDPNIALSFDNLQLVCRDCHAQIHDRRKRRYRIDELGRVIT